MQAQVTEALRCTSSTDCEGVGLTTAPATAFVSQLISVIGKHYPCRMGQIFICNVSAVFYFIWNVVSLSLAEMTVKKIQMKLSVLAASNPVDYNCLSPIIDAYGADTTGQPDSFDYRCPFPAENYEMLSQQFASQLCCFANQNAVLVSMNQVYPPCFMNCMSNKCSCVS